MGLEFLVNLCLHIIPGCVCLVHKESDKEIPYLMIMLEHMNYLFILIYNIIFWICERGVTGMFKVLISVRSWSPKYGNDWGCR
jgi:hypothetical protein